MKHWKPTSFKPEWPSPEEGCAFVLGGSLHGEIMQEKPLPRYFRHAAPNYMRHYSVTPGDEHQLSATIETYRLEEFRYGANQRSLWFYIHETDATDFLLVKAFTDLCMFLREARAAGVDFPSQTPDEEKCPNAAGQRQAPAQSQKPNENPKI